MNKKVFLCTLALAAALGTSAQVSTTMGRGRVENVTDTSVPAAMRLHRIGSRADAPLPCVGSPKVPVILVQFPDLPFTIEATPEAVQDNYSKYCNGTGIEGVRYQVSNVCWGSVSDYFIEQSDSLFRPEFTVLGPVTLSNDHGYYGKNEGGRKDVNMDAFYSEACQMALSTYGVDWSVFDNDGDGKVDFVFFIYAGLGENDKANTDPTTIWPKESVSAKSVTVGNKTVTFGAFGCTCELYNARQDGIGTMCHELSHGLGLPDFYDTNYNAFGLDAWDVMDAGCYQIDGQQPCCYSAYERDFMGWRALQPIEKDAAVTLTLKPMENGGVAYKILNDAQPSGNEYFILENRQNIGFDSYLGCDKASAADKYKAAHGMLITHVDFSANVWANNGPNSDANHQRITIVPADGKLDLSSSSVDVYHTSLRGDPYPGNMNVTEMSSYAVYTDTKGNPPTFTQTVGNIQELEDGTVIVDINGGTQDAIANMSGNGINAVEFYSVAGVKQDGLKRGFNIVRYDNGATKKVYSR